MRNKHQKTRIIILVRGQIDPIIWGLFERAGAMLRDYSRLESAKAIGIGINEIQGLRRNGTQDSQRKQALEQAYGDVVGIAQEQDWHPQLLLLTWLILSRSIAESSRK